MPSRKPKVLVQTAAHVSGAAFYYKPDNNSENQNSVNQNSDNFNRMIGICIHPSFGGWFAIRGVIIFTDVIFDSLKQKEPFDVIKSEDLKKELLVKFNKEWKDWTYRDIIPVSKKYSDLQIEYFKLKPCDRLAFLRQNLNFTSIKCRQN
jgi:methylmalonic aciduria homocystinuria type C protein